MLVLILMTVLAPIQFETEVTAKDVFGRVIETMSQCSYSDGQAPYVIVLAVINLACLAFASYQAFQARHLSTEYGERQYVFAALMVILLVCLVGIPVLLLARENADASTFVSCMVIFIACCSILSVMFVPKMRYFNLTKNQPPASHLSWSTRSALALGKDSSMRESHNNWFNGYDSSRDVTARSRELSMTGRTDSGLSQPVGGGGNGASAPSLPNTRDSLGRDSDDSGMVVYELETREELHKRSTRLTAENKALKERLASVLSVSEVDDFSPSEVKRLHNESTDGKRVSFLEPTSVLKEEEEGIPQKDDDDKQS